MIVFVGLFIRRHGHPFTCIVAAPTVCGSSTFVMRLLQHASSVIEPPPEKVLPAVHLYKYCVVGDSVVPLLKIVPIEGKHGDLVSKSFDSVQYFSVLHKEFTTAEVDIRDDAERYVPFERGRTTVTFHFRRRKPLLFET